MCNIKHRIDYVDISKGIGLILVVLSHTVSYRLMFFASGFYVPIFFVCAGYTYRGGGTFIENVKKRAVRLMKPYFFFSFILLICFMHFSLREFVGIFYSRYCLYLPDVVPNIKFLTSGNFPLWFLTCMLVSYVLFYVLIYYERYAVFLLLIYLFFTAILDKLPILLPWSIDTAFIMAILMYVGKKLRGMNMMPDDAIGLFSRFVVCLLLYTGAMLLDGEMNISVRIYGNSFLLYLLAAIFGCMMLLYFSKMIEKTFVGHVLLMFGKHSLTIFCIEIPFIYYGGVCFKFFISQEILPHYELALVLFQLCSAMVGGYVCSVIFNRFSITRKMLS